MSQICARVRLQVHVVPAVDQTSLHYIIHTSRGNRLLDRMPDDFFAVF